MRNYNQRGVGEIVGMAALLATKLNSAVLIWCIKT